MYTQTHTDVNTDSLVSGKYTFGYDSGMGLADRLDKKMQEMGVSQYKLAKESGVPQPTICRILDGTSADPRRKTLTRIADALKTTVEDLIYEKTGKVEALINDITAAELSDAELAHIQSLVTIFKKPKTARQIGPPLTAKKKRGRP